MAKTTGVQERQSSNCQGRLDARNRGGLLINFKSTKSLRESRKSREEEEQSRGREQNRLRKKPIVDQAHEAQKDETAAEGILSDRLGKASLKKRSKVGGGGVG